ncbi:hypothetical protein ACFLQW_03690 [Candidatus Zixiibacteriota bacterium]
MWDTVLLILGVVALLVVIELFALPEWVRRKLSNEPPRRETLDRLSALETRVGELEKKVGQATSQ